jgi:hypothetical protein
MAKPKDDEIKTIDDLDDAEFEKLYTDTVEQISMLESRWRGVVKLTEKARAKHHGKSIGTLIPALRTLFTAMLPNSHDDAETAKTRAKFAAAFDVHGDMDAGKDPEHFEAPLLLRRMRRVIAQQDVTTKLDAFSRALGDDTLHTGEMVLNAGEHALNTARSIGESNAKYSSFLTGVFDELRKMTKAALARQAELRAERAAAKAAVAAEAAKKADAPK